MKKSISAKELLSKRFGEEGTESRTKFKETAFAYYFGEILRNRRKELHMSQEELAQLVGKKRPYISRVENGEDIQLSNFAQIASALNLSIDISSEPVH